MSRCCQSFRPRISNCTSTTEILEFECIFLTFSTPCFLSKSTPRHKDIIYYIITLGTHSQSLTRIPKSEELNCNQGSIFVPNLTIYYAIHGSLLPKCRYFDSDVLPSHFKIQSYLDQELKTHTNAPPTKYTLPPTQWISTFLYYPCTSARLEPGLS